MKTGTLERKRASNHVLDDACFKQQSNQPSSMDLNHSLHLHCPARGRKHMLHITSLAFYFQTHNQIYVLRLWQDWKTHGCVNLIKTYTDSTSAIYKTEPLSSESPSSLIGSTMPQGRTDSLSAIIFSLCLESGLNTSWFGWKGTDSTHSVTGVVIPFRTRWSKQYLNACPCVMRSSHQIRDIHYMLLSQLWHATCDKKLWTSTLKNHQSFCKKRWRRRTWCRCTPLSCCSAMK